MNKRSKRFFKTSAQTELHPPSMLLSKAVHESRKRDVDFSTSREVRKVRPRQPVNPDYLVFNRGSNKQR